ncbi:MAG: DUF2057 domain-containing protein [Candidatus Thiodiazotropha sp. (ex Semelilucina semeliformis)]|nr:DUF2057 domain-containing protein [Candidatus Thiodiazotropha sp. (ex Semelilucina semeliformis)]
MNRAMLSLLLVVLSVQGHAGQLMIDDVFEILSVDGQESEGSLLKHVDRVELSEGSHEITLRYKDLAVDPDLGYEAVVVSQPFSISVNTVAGATYQIEPDKSAVRNKHAYAANPVVTIRSPGGMREVLVNKDLSTKPASKGRYGESATPQTSSEKQKISSFSKENETDIQERQSDPGERLRHWWGKADRKTRQLFMGWIVGNE